MKDVVMYTKQTCGFCKRAKQFLEEKGIAFQEIPIDGNEALRAEMIEKSEGRTTVPQIFIGGQGIGGYTDIKLLEQTNRLDELLAQ